MITLGMEENVLKPGGRLKRLLKEAVDEDCKI